MSDLRTIYVGMAGCGTVGCAVGDLLIRDHDALLARTGLDIRLVRAVVRDLGRSRAPHVPDELLTDDLSRLTGDDVDIVVEVIGGTSVAKGVVLAAIAAGKDVVTANKALLALHGPEIYAAARAAGVCVAFEASCAAGLPVIGAIQRGMVANRINAIEGILNGTCNYILSEMLEAGKCFADALADAQRLGYAEADPTLDIDGTDTAHKLAILATLAFGTYVEFAGIAVEGIERISLTDLLAGRELGLTCKLLAVGWMIDGVLLLRVRPVFLADTHPMAGVNGADNAVSLYGHAAGHVMLTGPGAGGASTASGIVSDVVEVALGNARRTFGQLPLFEPKMVKSATVVPPAAPDCGFYARFTVHDRPTALPKITAAFGEAGIKLVKVRSFDGDPPTATDGEHIVLLTNPASESKMPAVLKRIDGCVELTDAPICIPVLEPFERRS
ncbi:MAG: homoserine dehydrogenase [Phycisphaerae bacterium]|nr:homoserine dehydrogenase [Phycisphaerae bacterium]